MPLSDQSSASYPDELTPATVRRLQLWRAMTDLSKAQADGRLSVEQARLLEALADNLQQLATQLTQLAELGRQYAQALDPLLGGTPATAPDPASPNFAPTPAPAPPADAAASRPPAEQ
jgi:hypothetical protein